MRLFVAAELSDDMRRAVAAGGDDLRRRLGRRLTARWLPAESLHITVRFIGDVADDSSSGLIRAISAPLRLSPFEVRLRLPDLPPSGRPRVIWMALAEGSTDLAALNREMNERLAPLGFEPERRPYAAHLTMARVKDVARGSQADVRRIILESVSPNATCRVTYATIFRSFLSSKGARYESLASCPFLYP